MPNRYERLFVLASAAVTLASCAVPGPPPQPGLSPPPAVSNTRMPHAPPSPGPAAVPVPETETPPAPVSVPSPPVQATGGAAAGLIEDAAAFGALPPPQQEQRLKAAAAEYRKQGGPDALLRLALYSAVAGPGAAVDDGVRADLGTYIDSVRKGGADAQLLPLAQYAAALLDQRDEREEENLVLQRKLDELKAIEERLNRRDQRETIRIMP